ncbi:hypothetical protein C0989_004942 [Termitomyces sp. Mn162]|nr:hypothetical protein C0989_004942 [Termitomyces sp. Mn162]
MYPSATTTQASSRQRYGAVNIPLLSPSHYLSERGYALQVPKGFTVRVFKGPSVYSFPQAVPSHFNRGYQSVPLTEPRQSISNQIWYPRAQPTTLTPNEPQKTSRPPASSGASFTLSTDTRLLAYDPISHSKPPSYSIYQSSNDTFIYEASLSSKADLDSNSEDDNATTPDYIHSAFSPAMSTDSITTVRGANTPDPSLTDLRTSTPTPVPTSSSSRISFPLYIPGLAQAQTAIKGIFRSQTQNDSQPTAVNTSVTSRVTNTGSSSSTSSARSLVATPIRTSLTAVRTGERDTGNSTHIDRHASASDNARLPDLRSPISDDEDGEVDAIAKANAEFNAAASRAVPYYSAVRDSTHLSAVNSAASSTGVRDATNQLHPNPLLRNSPEQYQAQTTTTHAQPLYWCAPEMTRCQSVENHSSTRPLPEDQLVSTAQIPLSQNSGPSSRYVPASHTMNPGPLLGTSPEPEANQERHEQNSSSHSMSHVSPTITTSHVYREGGGADSSRSVSSADESRRGSMERQASYAPYRAEAPVIHQPTTLRTAPHQLYTDSSNHYVTATIQSNRDAFPDANSRYVEPMTTRPSGSVISHTLEHRTSPTQTYMYPSSQRTPHSRVYTTAPSSGERAANLVTSASTRVTNTSPSRTRRDSLAASPNSLPPRPSNAEINTAPTQTQGMPQQDRDINLPLRQSPVYENPRGMGHGSRLETERVMGDPYSRIGERQAAPVSNMPSQRGLAPNITSSSSARIRSETAAHTTAAPDRPQTPFPTPLREPQRRYSDSDSSVASHSTYGPAYASSSGGNLPPTGTSTATEASRTTEPQSQRRYSDGESNMPDRTSVTLFRTVRWNENLICPSPIFAHQRRKGWFNRRGDQLWTNDGAYKPPTLGQEYPPDLDGYPEHGQGWMNEQGVRIDMSHRLIPKAPLKSALKTSRPQQTPIQQES